MPLELLMYIGFMLLPLSEECQDGVTIMRPTAIQRRGYKQEAFESHFESKFERLKARGVSWPYVSGVVSWSLYWSCWEEMCRLSLCVGERLSSGKVVMRMTHAGVSQTLSWDCRTRTNRGKIIIIRHYKWECWKDLLHQQTFGGCVAHTLFTIPQ